MFINPITAQGLMYAENGRRRVAYDEVSALDMGAFEDAAAYRRHGCYRCPLKCGKRWTIRSGPFRGQKGYGYEVAHIISLGLTLGIRDVSEVLHLIKRMNAMGLDIKEFAGTIGMSIDAFQNGFLDIRATDGLELAWGNAGTIDRLLGKAAYRQGFGDILAEGTKRAARAIGSGAETRALHMKGMHWPGNCAPPYVLAFTLSPRGGDFLKGMPHLIAQPNDRNIARQLFGATAETFRIRTHGDKGRAVWWHENYKLLNDCIGTCFYLSQTLLAHGLWLPEHISEAYGTATGLPVNGKDLLKGAERGYQVERAINTLRGLDRNDDRFPVRPEKDSWAQGIDVDAPGMLDEYYRYRGLTSNGLPTRERLSEIGLEDVARHLEKHGCLEDEAGSGRGQPIDAIMRNPSRTDLKKGIRAAIQEWIRRRVMGKMAESPSNLRAHWRRQSRRYRRYA